MRSIQNTRCLFGAIALMIIGLMISALSLFFFRIEYFGHDIFINHWVWEITLNLQILCYALMWFAHHNQIMMSRGAKRGKALLNFFTAFFAASAPVAVLVTGAYFGWWLQPPPKTDIILINYFFAGTWMLGVFILPALFRLISAQKIRKSNGTTKQWFVSELRRSYIGLIMIGLMIAARLFDVDTLYIITPILGYAQGAMGYFRKAFRSQAAHYAY